MQFFIQEISKSKLVKKITFTFLLERWQSGRPDPDSPDSFYRDRDYREGTVSCQRRAYGKNRCAGNCTEGSAGGIPSGESLSPLHHPKLQRRIANCASYAQPALWLRLAGQKFSGYVVCVCF